MNAQVIQLPPIHVIMLRHSGPYEDISAVFDTLYSWINSHGVSTDRMIGIYWDNPDYVSANKLRSAACAEVSYGYQIMDTAGLPLTVENIAGGNYVTMTYVGPYEELAPVWTNFTNYIEKDLRKRISSNPAFEVYVNDPSSTPPDQLITELYMPVN